MACNLIYDLVPSNPNSMVTLYEEANDFLPEVVDLRKWDSKIENQSTLGSCVSNAIANAYELMILYSRPKDFKELSRLFIYYNSRLLEDHVSEDNGTTILSALISLKTYGVCSEDIWPYDITKFNTKPTDECYSDAVHRIIPSFSKIESVQSALESINNDHPVIAGIKVYQNFGSVNEYYPLVEMSDTLTGYVGLHAVTLVGYDLTHNVFIAKNSFGNSWGDGGYGYITIDYIEQEGFEMWNFDIPREKNNT